MLDDQTTDHEPVITECSALADSTLRQIEQIVCGVSAEDSLEQLCRVIDAADWLAARSKAIHCMAKQIAIAWIERHGEFVVGEMHYRVDYTSVTKCINPKQAALQLLNDVEGDFTTFLEFLVAQPFKHGSVRRVLDADAYQRLFKSTVTSRLVNGVPNRTLVRSRRV